jgi:hypothetical protein
VKDEALDGVPWITRFGSGYGPVVRQRHDNDDGGNDVTKTKQSANRSSVNVAKGKSVLIYRLEQLARGGPPA